MDTRVIPIDTIDNIKTRLYRLHDNYAYEKRMHSPGVDLAYIEQTY